ncbi:MAG: sigma-70 family RNA polymerase sigma factor [Bacteroidales bacterium]|nr:sigma-70 family RNA polymerase sigma factor [Bacteroidales bacterium]
MFGICLRYSKDYTEAEDTLQEGFIKVFENISSFKFKGSFEGWLRRIMVNTALEKYRKQNVLYPVSDIFEYAEDIGYDDITSDISAGDLLKLITELSPQYRVVFNLYAIEGYSHNEISKKLGISTGTSKSNLSRARQILQEKVKKLYMLNSGKMKLLK